ncbi:phosphatase PAP2 family protein [Candidatus Saccharibacteria bacterium]|nr:phosphatase PAP2 family protein [Candidatus Saccharibacteria bacterium]
MENRRTKISALIVVGLSAVVFMVLAILVKLGKFDTLNYEVYEAIATLINSTLTSVMILVSFLGEWYVWLTSAVILTLIAKTRANFGLPTLLATGAASAGAVLLKKIFMIPRPHINWLIQEVGYGFPSGHAMISTAFVAVAVYFFWQSRVRKLWKILLVIIGVLWLLAIGFSRIYLGVHTLSDVMAGFAAGLGVATATVYLKMIFQVVIRRR